MKYRIVKRYGTFGWYYIGQTKHWLSGWRDATIRCKTVTQAQEFIDDLPNVQASDITAMVVKTGKI